MVRIFKKCKKMLRIGSGNSQEMSGNVRKWSENVKKWSEMIRILSKIDKQTNKKEPWKFGRGWLP